MTKICAEVGSCHDGSKEKALDLIKMCAKAGADAVKFQLLTIKEIRGTGNIELPWKWMPELIEYGKKHKVEVFASVFNMDGVKWLRVCKCKSIKFAYSQQDLFIKESYKEFDNIYLSCDTTNEIPFDDKIKLYCIPLYPVPYIVDFEGIFPRFDGWSSHTLGIEQDKKAIDMGAKYIEKHVQGDWHSPTPDGKFAIRPKQLKELCKYARASTKKSK